ncbi:M23 family metallopeptidase [Chlamydiota bacterium]
MKILPLLLIFLTLANGSFAEDKKYHWPVKNGLGVISSSFCEFRRNHFHAGIDISTQGSKGIPALAVSDGILWEINVTHHGYGRKITLKLDDGTYVSYAHLDKFSEKINKIVKEGQEDLGRFNIKFHPQSDIRFKKGEEIGIIGDTGGFKPHLHIEFSNEEGTFINPLKNGLFYKGVFYPKIKEIAIVPIDLDSLINGKKKKTILTAWKDKKSGLYKVQEPITVNGRVGFEVKSEFLSEQGNKIAPYKIHLFIDGKLVFERVCHFFADSDYLKIFHAYDRELYLNGKGNFVRLFDITDDMAKMLPGEHNIEIGIENYTGEQKSLTFNVIVQSDKKNVKIRENSNNSVIVNKEEKIIKFDNDKLLVKFPSGTFKNPVEINFRKIKYQGNKKNLKPLTDIYTIIPEDIVPDQEFEIFIKIPKNALGRKEKIGVFQIEPQRIRFAGKDRESFPGYIGVKVQYPTRILLMEDSSSPSISHVKPSHGAKLKTLKPCLRASIVEKGSGLNYSSLKMILDKREVPAEFIVKSGIIKYCVPIIINKGKHGFEIIAEDNVGNKKVTKSEFFVNAD